jgi:hypothetical protein
VEERRVCQPAQPPEDDIVEVIEEHSPVRRPSRREIKRASRYRLVDPTEFGGGDRPTRRESRKGGNNAGNFAEGEGTAGLALPSGDSNVEANDQGPQAGDEITEGHLGRKHC